MLALLKVVPFMVLDDNMIDEKAASLLPYEIMLKYKAVPIGFENEKLLVAMMHPTDIIAIDDIHILTGYDIQPIIIPDFQLEAALEQVKSGIWGKVALNFEHKNNYDSAESSGIHAETETDQVEQIISPDIEVIDETKDRPAVQLANVIFNQAVESRASDVHIEPFGNRTRIRFRIDGVLHEIMNPPKKLHASLVSRIKDITNMVC